MLGYCLVLGNSSAAPVTVAGIATASHAVAAVHGLLNRYWLIVVGEHCVCVPAAETFPIGALEGHTDAIWSVAFAPRGYTLADVPSVSHDAVMDDLPILVSASADRTIRVWSFNPADTGAKLGVDERACALASRGVWGGAA